MEKIDRKVYIFFGINILLVLSYFFFYFINIRIPELEINRSWTTLVILINSIKNIINGLSTANFIVSNIMGLPSEGILISGGSFTKMVILILIGMLVPLGALITNILYWVNSDENRFSLNSMIISVVGITMMIGVLVCNRIWANEFMEIGKEISQNYSYLDLTAGSFRNSFSLGFGFYFVMILEIITVTYFLFIKFAWKYIRNYITGSTVKDDPMYFKSKVLSSSEIIKIKDGRKNMPFLTLLNGGKTLRISKVPCIIGRNRSEVDYYLYDESLSRKHCMIDIKNGEILVKDLNSLYGVQINNLRIDQEVFVSFKDGDYLKLGELVFKIDVDWKKIQQQFPEQMWRRTQVQDEASMYTDLVISKRVIMSSGNEDKGIPIMMLYPEKENFEFPCCMINKSPFLLGRSKRDVDFSIRSSNVSRKHCMIEYYEGDFYISDLSSSNGTRVNGIKLKEKEKKKLFIDDRIKIGESIFYFKE